LSYGTRKRGERRSTWFSGSREAAGTRWFLSRYSLSRNKFGDARAADRGGIEIFVVILAGFFVVTFLFLIEDMVMHRRVGNATAKRIQLLYAIEGVLIEAQSLLENFQEEEPESLETLSTFAPEFTMHIAFEESIITVFQDERQLAEASFSRQGSVVKIAQVKSFNNIPYTR